jgi:hypothetical protein
MSYQVIVPKPVQKQLNSVANIEHFKQSGGSEKVRIMGGDSDDLPTMRQQRALFTTGY